MKKLKLAITLIVVFGIIATSAYASPFDTLLDNMNNFFGEGYKRYDAFFSFTLIFMLLFAIAFAGLSKALGMEQKKVAAAISIAFAAIGATGIVSGFGFRIEKYGFVALMFLIAIIFFVFYAVLLKLGLEKHKLLAFIIALIVVGGIFVIAGETMDWGDLNFGKMFRSTGSSGKGILSSISSKLKGKPELSKEETDKSLTNMNAHLNNLWSLEKKRDDLQTELSKLTEGTPEYNKKEAELEENERKISTLEGKKDDYIKELKKTCLEEGPSLGIFAQAKKAGEDFIGGDDAFTKYEEIMKACEQIYYHPPKDITESELTKIQSTYENSVGAFHYYRGKYYDDLGQYDYAQESYIRVIEGENVKYKYKFDDDDNLVKISEPEIVTGYESKAMDALSESIKNQKTTEIKRANSYYEYGYKLHGINRPKTGERLLNDAYNLAKKLYDDAKTDNERAELAGLLAKILNAQVKYGPKTQEQVEEELLKYQKESGTELTFEGNLQEGNLHKEIADERYNKQTKDETDYQVAYEHYNEALKSYEAAKNQAGNDKEKVNKVTPLISDVKKKLVSLEAEAKKNDIKLETKTTTRDRVTGGKGPNIVTIIMYVIGGGVLIFGIIKGFRKGKEYRDARKHPGPKKSDYITAFEIKLEEIEKKIEEIITAKESVSKKIGSIIDKKKNPTRKLIKQYKKKIRDPAWLRDVDEKTPEAINIKTMHREVGELIDLEDSLLKDLHALINIEQDAKKALFGPDWNKFLKENIADEKVIGKINKESEKKLDKIMDDLKNIIDEVVKSAYSFINLGKEAKSVEGAFKEITNLKEIRTMLDQHWGEKWEEKYKSLNPGGIEDEFKKEESRLNKLDSDIKKQNENLRLLQKFLKDAKEKREKLEQRKVTMDDARLKGFEKLIGHVDKLAKDKKYAEALEILEGIKKEKLKKIPEEILKKIENRKDKFKDELTKQEKDIEEFGKDPDKYGDEHKLLEDLLKAHPDDERIKEKKNELEEKIEKRAKYKERLSDIAKKLEEIKSKL